MLITVIVYFLKSDLIYQENCEVLISEIREEGWQIFNPKVLSDFTSWKCSKESFGEFVDSPVEILVVYVGNCVLLILILFIFGRKYGKMMMQFFNLVDGDKLIVDTDLFILMSILFYEIAI